MTTPSFATAGELNDYLLTCNLDAELRKICPEMGLFPFTSCVGWCRQRQTPCLIISWQVFDKRASPNLRSLPNFIKRRPKDGRQICIPLRHMRTVTRATQRLAS